MSAPPAYTEKPTGAEKPLPTPTAPPPPHFSDAMISGGDRRPRRGPGVVEGGPVQLYEAGGQPAPPGVAVSGGLQKRFGTVAWGGVRPVMVTVTHGGHTMTPHVATGLDDALRCITAPPGCNCDSWSATVKQGQTIILVVATRA